MTPLARAEAVFSLVLGILWANQILQLLLSSVYILSVSGSQVVELSRQRFFEDTVSPDLIHVSDTETWVISLLCYLIFYYLL